MTRAVTAPGGTAATAHALQGEGEGDRPLVLVVVDDRDCLRTLTDVCARQGVRMLNDSPAAALALLAAQAICGVIVECELRQGSGLEVAAQARMQHNIPTLLLSGQNTHRWVHEAYLMGARYLCRPVEPSELEMFVSAAAAQRRLADASRSEALATLAHRSRLTPRETQVIELALSNTPRSAMASALGITESTLKFHIRSLLHKCDARNVSELARSILIRLGQAARTQP